MLESPEINDGRFQTRSIDRDKLAARLLKRETWPERSDPLLDLWRQYQENEVSNAQKGKRRVSEETDTAEHEWLTKDYLERWRDLCRRITETPAQSVAGIRVHFLFLRQSDGTEWATARNLVLADLDQLLNQSATIGR